MRKVVLYQLLSLDGVAEEPGDWFFDDGPDVVENLRRVIALQEDVVLGRGTFEYWVGYWPTSEFEPFASFINGTRKHLVTSTRPTAEWANTTVVGPPLEGYIVDLKRQPGGEIGIHGSITLAQFLLRMGLVDELKLVIAPTLAGRGRRLFEGDALHRLELLDVERSAKGTLFATYRCAT